MGYAKCMEDNIKNNPVQSSWTNLDESEKKEVEKIIASISEKLNSEEKNARKVQSQDSVIIIADLNILSREIKDTGMNINKIIACNNIINDEIEKIYDSNIVPEKNLYIASEVERLQKILLSNVQHRYKTRFSMVSDKSKEICGQKFLKYIILYLK